MRAQRVQREPETNRVFYANYTSIKKRESTKRNGINTETTLFQQYASIYTTLIIFRNSK